MLGDHGDIMNEKSSVCNRGTERSNVELVVRGIDCRESMDQKIDDDHEHESKL